MVYGIVPCMAEYMETNFDLTKPRHSELILPGPSIIKFVQIQTSFSLLFGLFLLEAKEVRDFFLSSQKNRQICIYIYRVLYTKQQQVVLHNLGREGFFFLIYTLQLFNSIISKDFHFLYKMACLKKLVQLHVLSLFHSLWVQFSKEPSVFVTVAHHHAGLKRDAASIWLENISLSSFKLCLRELQNYAGSHEDIYVVRSIHLYFYLFPGHTCITRRCDGAVKLSFSIFRTGWPSCLFTSLCSRNTAQSIFQTLSHQDPGTITLSAGSVLFICCHTSRLSFNYILTYLTCVHLFIQDISFTKVYKNAPSVFVSANHTSSGGGLNPMYNSITAWVEVSQRSAQSG